VSTRGHGPSNQPSSMRPSNGTSNQPSSVIPLDVCSTKASIIIDSVGGLPLVDKEHWYKGATDGVRATIVDVFALTLHYGIAFQVASLWGKIKMVMICMAREMVNVC